MRARALLKRHKVTPLPLFMRAVPLHVRKYTPLLYSISQESRASPKILIEGRIHRHPNPPTIKFCFSSDFGHFILKMLENTKITRFKKTDTEISKFLGGFLRGFQKWGS